MAGATGRQRLSKRTRKYGDAVRCTAYDRGGILFDRSRVVAAPIRSRDRKASGLAIREGICEIDDLEWIESAWENLLH